MQATKSSFTRLIAERFVESRIQPTVRSQRLVAALRCLTSLFLFLAVATTARQPFALALVSVYFAYAAIVLAAQRSAAKPLLPRVAALAIDLAVIGTLLYDTGGASSPLFAALVFVVFSSTYLTSVRAMILAGVLILAAFVGIAGRHGLVESERPFFLMRIGFLVAASIGLIVRRSHETRVREELAQFAAWPRAAGLDAATMFSELSRALANLARTPRVVIVWEEKEEPWLHVVMRGPDALDITREAPRSASVLLPTAFDPVRFVWQRSKRADAFLRLGPEGLERWPGVRWPDGFLERFAPQSVVSVPIAGDVVNGRVYLLDGAATTDTLHVAEVAVRLITADLEQQYLIDRLYDAAAAQERTRVARDLHDGLLQSLTGISLQLASLEHADGADVRRQIHRLRELVEADHAQLRSFVTRSRTSGVPLDRRLEQIAAGIEQRWSIAVRLDVQRARKSIDEPLADEICSMATEALSNAAKHAEATQVSATFAIDDDSVAIEISDDGHGFPFRGRFDLDAMTRHQNGPRMLRERVVALHGGMVVDSSSSGARVEIRVPLSHAV